MLNRDGFMCNLYSITTNQAAIIALFRVINRYVGNLPPMPGVFPDYATPVIRNNDTGRELAMMRWGMPPLPRTGGPPIAWLFGKRRGQGRAMSNGCTFAPPAMRGFDGSKCSRSSRVRTRARATRKASFRFLACRSATLKKASPK